MNRWNRKIRSIEDSLEHAEFKIERIKPRRRKEKHAGYTIMPESRLKIFENGGNKKKGEKF